MRPAFSVMRWPLVFKVPLMVTGLMLLAAILMSGGVLLRLTQEQESRIEALSGAYLEAASATLATALARQDVWEAFDILDRSKRNFGGLRLRLAAAILPDGRVLAATDPRRLPVGAMIGPDLSRHLGAGLTVDATAGLAWSARPVVESGVELGKVLLEIDISEEWRERLRLGLLLVAANAGLALALAAAGWWSVRRMLRPVELLTRQLGRGTTEAPTEVAPSTFGRSSPEFTALFETYNAMVRAAGQREVLTARLAEEERLATLGTLAGSMAHEVNNPLGGMMTALDTIAEHGAAAEVRAQSVGFLRRGLEDIRNVVHASLVLYKTSGEPTPLSREGLDDLRYLAGPEAARRSVQLVWDNRLDILPAIDATAVRQAVLNLLLNAVAASPPRGTVSFSAKACKGRLTVAVTDQGPGLPPAMEAILSEARSMPPAGSTGLGLWTAVRVARAMNGTIRRETTAAGTTLVLDIPVAWPVPAGMAHEAA